MLRLLGYLLLFLFVFNPVKAQIEEPYTLGKVKLSRTIQSDEIRCMLQDKNGALWLGGSKGLYSLHNGGEKLIPSLFEEQGNAVSAISMDPKGSIWVGFEDGTLARIEKDKLVKMALPKEMKGSPISGIIHHDGVWVSSYGKGLAHIQDGKAVYLNNLMKLPDPNHYCLVALPGGGIATGTDAGIIIIRKPGKVYRSEVIGSEQGLPDLIVRSLALSEGKDLYAGMQDSGICRVSLQGKKVLSRLAGTGGMGPVGFILPVEQDLVFSVGKYLYKYSKINEKKLQIIVQATQGTYSSGRPYIRGILYDREKKFWVICEDGLFKCEQKRMLFRSYTKHQDKVSFNQLAVLPDRRLLLVNSGSTLISTSPFDTALASTTSMGSPAAIKDITCVAFWNQMHVVGTLSRGLMMIDRSGKELVLTNDPMQTGDGISCLKVDRNGDLWAGTFGAGVLCLRNNRGGIEIRQYAREQGLTATYVYAIEVDSENEVIVGTDRKGIFKSSGERFVPLSTDKTIVKSSILSISAGMHDELWCMLNEGGIARLSKDGKVETAKPGSSWFSHDPLSFFTYGEFVFSCSESCIERYNLLTQELAVFTYPDHAGRPLPNAYAIDYQSKHLFLGCEGGIISFVLPDLPEDFIAPICGIELFEFNNRPREWVERSSFPYSGNRLAFTVFRNYFSSTSGSLIKYRLKGLETDFSYTSNKKISYSNLPPGSYTLELAAANSAGRYGIPATFSFSIKPPIWWSPLFWIIIFLFAAAGVFGFVQWRFRRINREKAILEAKVEQRTREILDQKQLIELKNIELERLSVVARETGNSIMILSRDGTLEWVNDSFVRWYGKSLAVLRAEGLDSIFKVSGCSDIHTVYARCIDSGDTVSFESYLNMPARQVWFSSTMSPVYNSKRELVNLIVIETDISVQKESEAMIRQKNTDITQSIEYAKRIQNSILPGMLTIKQTIPDSFIFFRQKDIVSGDFFWFKKYGDSFLIAAVDCTGHGVPGAFMSLIGYNLLNQVVSKAKLQQTGKILDMLSEKVYFSLNTGEHQDTRDGMDIAICAYDAEENKLFFSGAMRPLYRFEGSELIIQKGDAFPIGFEVEKGVPFQGYATHSIPVRKGQRHYIFSDGYPDQFGGEKGKKLMTSGFKKILATVQPYPMLEQMRRIDQFHREWRGGHEQVDDILVIGFVLPEPQG